MILQQFGVLPNCVRNRQREPRSIIWQRAYARKGIYVLWLLQWTPYLDGTRYSPRLWEKWIHAAYFGRVYYWIDGLNVVSYHFDPYLKHVSESKWYSEDGEEMSAGGYSKKSKRYRSPVRGEVLNLTKDFIRKEREFWMENGFTIPSVKLFMEGNSQ